MSKNWVSHGIWNTAEHALTRIGDAALTLLVIWLLQVELFSSLVLAQAVTAPLLVLFVSPSWALYHGYARWKKAGAEELGFRVHSLRRFGVALGQFAFVVAALAAFALRSELSWSERWAAMIWAMVLSVGPVVAAADRELLRLELSFRPLCWLTVLQKGILLAGTVAVGRGIPGKIWPLAAVAVFSIALSAFIARQVAEKIVPSRPSASPGALVRSWFEVFREFSFWNHVSGLIQNWLQTLDVICLGFVSTPARALGLYGVALKLGNFAMALPQAMGSLLLVRTGRGDEANTKAERFRVLKAAGALGLFVLVQNALFALAAPWILQVMSQGRWSGAEQMVITGWLYWILPGAWCLAVGYLLFIWLQLRGIAQDVLYRVYLPALVVGVVAYASSAWRSGVDGVARANLVVGAAMILLLVIEFARVHRAQGEGT